MRSKKQTTHAPVNALAATMAALLIASSAASANSVSTQQNSSEYYEAEVLSASPVYSEVRVNQPREKCWTEQVEKPAEQRYNSKTPEILGAIVGAAVGHEFGGSKRSHHAAAAAGAVLGTSVGHDWDKRRQAKTTQTTAVERCETVDNYSTEQNLSGYDVSYAYNGGVYQTFTQNHPGERIRLRVSVTPVE